MHSKKGEGGAHTRPLEGQSMYCGREGKHKSELARVQTDGKRMKSEKISSSSVTVEQKLLISLKRRLGLNAARLFLDFDRYVRYSSCGRGG